MLKLLVTSPGSTDTFCRFLSTAPLTAEHKLELERLLLQEPLCIYSWQKFLLWQLLTKLRHHTSSLMAAAHAVLRGDLRRPEAGAAALYLGAFGDYADRKAIAAAVVQASAGMVRRSMQIAIQELHRAERNSVYGALAEEDSEADFASSYLAGLSRAVYVSTPPRIAMDDLPDSIPSVY